MKKILVSFILLLLFRVGAFAQLPDFTKTDCNGVSHHLYDDLSNGNAVILAFGAGWCGPCRESDPLLEATYRKFGSGQCHVKTYLMLFETNTPGVEANCTFSTNYANHFNLTMPVISSIGTFFTGLVNEYFVQYNVGGIPAFFIILPNTANPANSTVKFLEGNPLDLVQALTDSLALGGFYPPPTISLSGNLCSDPLGATLTSGFASGNVWSTGATTSAIDVSTTGVYEVTSGGCTSSKYVEFLPALGNASLSTPVVCQDGFVTIDYSVPPGNTQNVTWVYKEQSETDWYELAPADLGPLTFTVPYPPGSVIEFAVRTINGTDGEATPCQRFSNIVTLTVDNSAPTILTNTFTLSASQVCGGSAYTANYTGDLANASLQYYDDIEGGWIDWMPLDNGQFDLPAVYPATTVNGFPGDRLRIKAPYGSCYSLSNEVEIAYLPVPSPIIDGPDVACNSNSVSLSVADANGQSYTSILWSPGGSTSPSINVNATQTTTYSVTVSNSYGCGASTSKTVYVFAKPIPVIVASPTGVICPGTPVTLSFAGLMSVSPCLTSPNGQYPETDFTPTCDGTAEIITEFGYAGEYSVVNVQAGTYYLFASLTGEYGIKDDIVTISNSAGTTAYATGTGYTIWKANSTGPVRFYTHEPACGDNQDVRMRVVLCLAGFSEVASFSWSPGGQTTPSITVNPNATTNYVLNYVDLITQCSNSKTIQVSVNISNSALSTTNVTSNSAKLNWTATADPAQWQLQYKSTKQGSKWQDVLLSGDKRSHTLTGLTSNQEYNWHIRAKCGNSWSEYSGAQSFKTLASGSRTASPDMRMITGVAEEDGATSLKADASPNPSIASFRISIMSNNSKEAVNLFVTDMFGRLIETRVVNPGQVITIGEKYSTGTYFVKLLQAGQRTQLKLVKVAQ